MLIMKRHHAADAPMYALVHDKARNPVVAYFPWRNGVVSRRLRECWRRLSTLGQRRRDESLAVMETSRSGDWRPLTISSPRPRKEQNDVLIVICTGRVVELPGSRGIQCLLR